MILLALAAACLAAAAWTLVAPRRALRATVERAARYGRSESDAPDAPAARGGAPAVHALARAALLAPRTTRASAAAAVLAAGGRLSSDGFLAAKAAAALGGAVSGLLLGAASGGAGTAVLLALALGAGGFLVPDALLRARARARRDEILASLPNALDLLAVSVEAGLGLDGAVARYADTARGPLAEELARVGTELRVGATRQEVLRRFAERVPAPETAAFVRAVLHADQLGVSLTQTLRTQAAEARRQRQAHAEEVANKAPVKMLFPTVFFVFPALFAVVLGPAVLHLVQVFS